MNTIHIASAIITRPDGRALLVRKRGATAFMQAGGKIDAGETPAEALARELGEELNLTIAPDAARFVGRFEAPAANEPDHVVIAEIFRLEVADMPLSPAAEIEEIRWIDPKAPGALPLAPLTRDHILPKV
ncbi:NUDIX hydrolase [Paenirhodobacter populi]|uniref:NUDIX hydrolase n=1 Tax=Paenirhodobacter populi TaxID=2306993 RepID=UPI001F4FF6C3|nr:NUDIX domain-containing protein [Sinirhodobacter populi]